MRKRYAIVAAIVALAVPVYALAEGGGTVTRTCDPSEWIKVTVTQPNGDVGTTVVKRLPPPDAQGRPSTLVGTSNDAERVTVDSNGNVKASGGEVVVECITPR
jgi:hypothetical protein